MMDQQDNNLTALPQLHSTSSASSSPDNFTCLSRFRFIKEKMMKMKKRKSIPIFSIANDDNNHNHNSSIGTSIMKQQSSQGMKNSQSSNTVSARRVKSTACIIPPRPSSTSSQAWETQSTSHDETSLRDKSLADRSVLRRRASTQMFIDGRLRGDILVPRPLRRSTQPVLSVFPRAKLQNNKDGEGQDNTSMVFLGSQRLQRESARYLSKAPAPAAVSKGKDKAGARRNKEEGGKSSRETKTKTETETDTATGWADMLSELSDNSETIHQLMIELGLPHAQVSTPTSLSSVRRVRVNDSSTEIEAAKAEAESEAKTEEAVAAATLQHDEVFFSPKATITTNNKPAVPAAVSSDDLKKPSSFHPQGAWGDIKSLTDDTGSSISIDPSLLHAPLPRNTVELLHEVADRCGREFARLRLNIRMMTEAEKKAEEKVVRLERELKIAKREQEELLSRFAELVSQARAEVGSRPSWREAVGVRMGTDEGDIRLPSGLSGYEADLGDVDGVDLKEPKKHGKKHVRHLVPGALKFEGAERVNDR